MTTHLTQPIKWHGGKHYLAPKIVALMPPHLHYVEPFAGGLSVLLTKDPEGVSEVVNDLNRELTNFWRVLQDECLFANFQRLCEATPFSRCEFEDSDEPSHLAHVEAHRFFVRVRQSLAGRSDTFAPLSKSRTRRGMNEQVSAWLTAVEGLPAVHARLKRVVVENLPAIELIRREDSPTTLFYCDPPYLHETRSTTTEYGQFEMSVIEHSALLAHLLGCKGKVMLSGYRSYLYDHILSSWHRHDFDLPNNASGAKTKERKTECLWCNF